MGKNETTLGPFSLDACVETILWKQSGGTDQQGWSHRINLKMSVGEQNLPGRLRALALEIAICASEGKYRPAQL
jgi:hypothetical protein